MATLAFACTLLSGCTTRIGDLTFVSTRNIDLSHVTLDVRQGKRVKGNDCKFALLGLIPLGFPTLQSAVDDALDKGQGNVMIDEVTYISNYWFVLVSQQCIRVEGTVLDTQAGS
jgi:hypothetical protein